MTAKDPTLDEIRANLSQLVELVCLYAEQDDAFRLQLGAGDVSQSDDQPQPLSGSELATQLESQLELQAENKLEVQPGEDSQSALEEKTSTEGELSSLQVSESGVESFKVRALKVIEAVCSHAEKNQEFQARLAQNLKIKRPKAKPKAKSSYNLFDRLKTFENDFSALETDLLAQDKDELVLIGVAYKIAKKKILSEMEKDELIKRLVQYAQEELGQWGKA